MKKKLFQRKTTFQIKNLSSHINWYNVIILIITFLVVCSISIYLTNYEKITWQVGDIANKTLIAKNIISYRDYNSEKYIKDNYIKKSIGYTEVPNHIPDSITKLNSLFNVIKTQRKTQYLSKLDIDTFNLKIAPYINHKFNDETIYYLFNCSSNDLNNIQEKVIYVTTYILSKPLKEDSYYIQEAYNKLENLINNKYKNNYNNIYILDIVKNTITPNFIYSENETKYIKNKLISQCPEIYRTIMPGDILITKGEVIDSQKFELLKKSGIFNNSILQAKNIGLILIIIFAFLYILIFLNKFKLLNNHIEKSLLLSIIIILCFLGIFFVNSLLQNSFDNYKLGFICIMWIISTVMLLYNLLSKYLSMFVLVFLSIIVGYALGNDIRIMSLSLICGMCALWAVSKISARSQLILIYLSLILITSIQVLIIGLVYSENINVIVFDQIKYSIFFIPSSVLLYFIFSTILERIFNLSTEMRLLELSNVDNSLLKNLAIKAPGTYTHCISVAYIAQLCAQKINANALLSKVGAYYHDIGKLNNPDYFTENQINGNIHNEIKPQLSVMVIRSHVKLGVEYAKKYKLPKKIIDIITQHHGTSLVSYFYSQFKDNNTSLINIESQFRYEGPKPQTKEAAIVMIADSVEAASRSIKDPSPSKIETLVNTIVSAKLTDGQFNECPLTIAEISQIKLVCINTLLHTLHSRISYPNITQDDLNKEKNNDDN